MESLTPYSFRSNLVTAKLNSRINEVYSTSFMAGYYGINNDLGSNYWTELRNVQLEWRNALHWNDRLTTTAGFAWQRSLYTVKSGMPGGARSLVLESGEHLLRLCRAAVHANQELGELAGAALGDEQHLRLALLLPRGEQLPLQQRALARLRLGRHGLSGAELLPALGFRLPDGLRGLLRQPCAGLRDERLGRSGL